LAARIKKHEKLTESNIQHVIDLLESEKPITKKEACSILNITYNTTRLNNIIEEHKETIKYRELRKAQNKGRGVTEAEKKSIVTYYLEGANISDIAKALYRSPAFIKAVIERLGIPQKLANTDYEGIRNAMLPEQCVSENFQEGERVWAVRKNCIATILREDTRMNYEEKYGSKYYTLWVTEMAECESPYFGTINNAGHYSGSLAYDLGSLRHLEEYL
jgi:transposase